ncbi:trehalose-6-phosphate hydrolase [Escherichia coli]|uniref:Trehalose-6-phosphate hydrolase n=1 Tax=Escherichia coli TaxID=562 RepID=A0A376L1U1_ECOLX|nr:trehalose-6-phosphate hydrolase [Escherichia coli]
MFAELRNDGRDADELLAILASKSRDNSPHAHANGATAIMPGLRLANRGLAWAITINKST